MYGDRAAGVILGIDGRPLMSGLRVDGEPVRAHTTDPGELVCGSAGSGSVRIWVPTRAPALLCEFRVGDHAGHALEWTAPDGTQRSAECPASSFEDGAAYLALSSKGETLWAGVGRNPDWPRGLGPPTAVPERVRREHATAADNRLRLSLEGDPDIRNLQERVQDAIANVGAWVTKGPDGEPVAVASYGREGARPASASERGVLARALLSLGQYEDVNRWSSLGLLDEDTAHVRTSWLGGENTGEGEHLWRVAEAHPQAPMHVAQATFLLKALHDTLGLRPDASYGRAGVAPHCRNLTGFSVEDLRIGTSQFTLTYRRGAGRHRFEARQTWGVVPVMLVLEPWLPVPADAPATVDGQPGEPGREPEDGGTRIRLQMPLEAERSLEIGTERSGGPES